MGLGWDPAKRGRDIDLDASVIVVNAQGRKVDAVWFMAKSAFGGAIEHSGDNLTGAGEGDDEVITVDLGRLPAEAHALVFTVNSFRGQKFTDVRNAYCRLLDLESGAELVRYDLTESERSTGVIMSVLVRSGAGLGHDGHRRVPRRQDGPRDVRARRAARAKSALRVDGAGGACNGRTMAEETIFTWGAPPLKFGPGAADEVGFEMAGLGVRRALIVTDPGVSALGAPHASRTRCAGTTSRARSSTACTSSRPTTR